MKRWMLLSEESAETPREAVRILLAARGMSDPDEIRTFLSPPDPLSLSAGDVGIDADNLRKALDRIALAKKNGETVIVYADYDADGVTSGAIMWEALHRYGLNVIPYIPHRVEEGYGLSEKGIDTLMAEKKPSLIVTVDHGISAAGQVAYAKSKGIDVIITDHHVPPAITPAAYAIVHTTRLSGAGVAWFTAKELPQPLDGPFVRELLSLAAIGTVADMVPLTGANRSLVTEGLRQLRKTARPGLLALALGAGIDVSKMDTKDISHGLTPRLNAMGRLDHAMDALRILCTRNANRAEELSAKLSETNRDRQVLTAQATLQSKGLAREEAAAGGVIFIEDEGFNQGIIGLVAGKLTEEFFVPSIIVAKGEGISKASARSVAGFNIIEALRQCGDILSSVGGHPMAAGFTIETSRLGELKERINGLFSVWREGKDLSPVLSVDMALPAQLIGDPLYDELRLLSPFGFGNPEPVFQASGLSVLQNRTVGQDGKHLKLRLQAVTGAAFDAIGFGMSAEFGSIPVGGGIDAAFSLDRNTWNGTTSLQFKLKDIHPRV